MKKPLAAALLCALAACAVTLTGCRDQPASIEAESSYSKGVAAYEASEDAEAASWFRIAADGGDAKAQMLLGMMHFFGEGVPQERTEAMSWIKLAADQGDPDGQFWFGLLAMMEFSDTQNEVEQDRLVLSTLHWFKLAADQGHATALVYLGENYFSCRTSANCTDSQRKDLNEVGVPMDISGAEALFMLAAEQGDASGLIGLGSRYRYGYDVPEDPVEAVRLYKLAADGGDATGQHQLASMYLYGEGVPENYVEAARLYRLAAEQGYSKAQHALGNRYRYGDGLPKNSAEAVRWLTLAANSGEIGAQIDLTFMYTAGDGVTLDYVQAYKWYNILAARPYSSTDVYRRSRDELARKMTPEQIAEAQRLSSEWKPITKRALSSFLR